MKSIIGAVIGDVVGSIYEIYECQNNQIDLSHRLSIFKNDKDIFESDMSFTDDSVLTCAIADAILQGQTYESRLREFGLKEESLGLDMYGRSRFGANFLKWLHGGGNNSFGNGCAMRVSPIGYAYDSLEETLKQAEISCKCTHDNIDAINMTKAVAGAYFGVPNKLALEVQRYIPSEYMNIINAFDEKYCK